MIERDFVKQKINEFKLQEYVSSRLNKFEHTKIEIKKTPLGEKIIIHTNKPGMIVGKKGENIKEMTIELKEKFGMKNPQIDVADIQNPNLDPNVVGDKIKYILESYGAKRFKMIGYNALKEIMDAGAIGAEVVISGKVPSTRSKSWRFVQGYLKKSGDVSENKVLKAHTIAKLKVGILGIKISIMPPNLELPDKIIIYDKPLGEGKSENKKPTQNNKVKVEKKRRTPKKKGSPKEKETFKKTKPKKEIRVNKETTAENGNNQKE